MQTEGGTQRWVGPGGRGSGLGWTLLADGKEEEEEEEEELARPRRKDPRVETRIRAHRGGIPLS